MSGTTESKLEYLIRSKEDVRLAINRMLVPCPEDTPFLEYGPKIKQVDVDLSDATVTSDDLMEGVIAYDAKEQRLVGTIPDNGRLEYEPSDELQIIPRGRTDGGMVKKTDITKLNEYQACLTLANSVDNLESYTDTTATPADLAIGKVAYSNGERIIGTSESIGNNGIFVPATQSQFTAASALSMIDFSDIDISHITSFQNAFQSTGIQEIKNLDTSNGTNFYQMFYNCPRLVTAPEIDTRLGKDFRSMFNSCTKLEKIPKLSFAQLTSINASNTSDMCYNIFYKCTKLKEIHLEDIQNIAEMNYLFKDLTALTKITGLEENNITSANSLFSGCKALTEPPEMDFSHITQAGHMFANCTFSKIPEIWEFTSLTTAGNLFRDCTLNVDELCLNLPNCTSVSLMFYNLKGTVKRVILKNTKNIQEWNTHGCSTATYYEFDASGTTNLNNLFSGWSSLEDIGNSKFTKQPTSMGGMFQSCSQHLIDLVGSQLDTSKATDFSSLFAASKITEIPSWLDFSSCTNTQRMFQNCKSLVTADFTNTKGTIVPGQYFFSSCNARNVYGMRYTGDGALMFKDADYIQNLECYAMEGATTLAYPNKYSLLSLKAHNVNFLTTFPSFSYCSKMTTIEFPNADFSGLTSLTGMPFQYCTALSNESLNELMRVFTRATQLPTKTLKQLGFTSAQASTCTTLSNWAAMSAAGWTTGY
jgi:hypothetical protein